MKKALIRDCNYVCADLMAGRCVSLFSVYNMQSSKITNLYLVNCNQALVIKNSTLTKSQSHYSKQNKNHEWFTTNDLVSSITNVNLASFMDTKLPKLEDPPCTHCHKVKSWKPCVIEGMAQDPSFAVLV